jgi:NAD(P)-dependent dehydrogenase (short-subunit alcohol dehydrogenase family)
MNEVATMADDPELREMTCDPKSRNVLVTDAATAPGQALVRALVAAGAGSVWAGHAGDALPDLAQSSGVTRVALDVSDSASVKRAAAEIGGKVDILINTAQARGTGGANSRTAIDSARGEMDINYFGLLRLAQEFGPHMRAERPRPGAVAWVNVLSIYALTNFPAHGTFSASQAAALSLSQCLRVEMRPAGIRVVNVFPGPLDEESNRALPPPKLGHNALASAVVAALRDGIEDVYPGDVAQDWLARFRESPKILEREMSL